MATNYCSTLGEYILILCSLPEDYTSQERPSERHMIHQCGGGVSSGKNRSSYQD